MKKYLGKILAGVSILLAVLAIIMLVAPGLSPKSDYKALGAESYKLAEVVFGKELEMGAGFGLSAGLLVALILLVAGIACSVVALLGKGGKIVPIVGAVLLVVGGILFFCTTSLYAIDLGDAAKDLPSDIKDAAIKELKEGINKMYGLGAGAIMAGIFSVLSGAACAATIFVNKD